MHLSAPFIRLILSFLTKTNSNRWCVGGSSGLQAKWPQVCEAAALLLQTATVKYVGIMFQADLSRQPAEAKAKKLFEQFSERP